MATNPEVEALTVEVRGLRKTIAEEKEAKRQARRWATAAVLAVLALGLYGHLSNGWRIDGINQARNEARLSSCLAYNEDIAGNVNALNDRSQDLLDQTFNAPQAQPRTPAKQAQVDEYLTEQKGQYEAVKIPLRDCSRAGIAAYYARR